MSAELDLFLDDARALLEAGDRPAAVDAYLRALSLSPGLPAACDPLWRIFYESAESHYAGKGYEEASYFVSLALAVKPGEPDATALLGAIGYHLGTQHLSEGRLDEAEPLLNQALAGGTLVAEARTALATLTAMRAEILLKQGDAAAGLALLRKAAEIDPDHETIRKFLATVLANETVGFYNQSRFPEAVPSIAEAMALDPSSEWVQKVSSKVMLQVAPLWEPDETGQIVIPHLEMDVAYACNLHCDGCTHYSDYSVKGHVDFETGREWLEAWSKKVYPRLFRMLGGEPTLNPRLLDFVKLAHKLWPAAIREVVSNGFFIDRHPGLFEALGETGTALQISVHEESDEYLGQIKLDKVREASQKFGFSFTAQYGTDEDFYRLYQGKGPTMRPFNDKNPAKSAAVCGNTSCTTLHLGRLWKCPPIAFLNNIEERFGLNQVAEWQPYLQHKGLTADATPDQLRRYIGGTQYFCAMCPASQQGGDSGRFRYPA